MKIPPAMWTRTLARLLVLMGLLVAPLHVRAQEDVEFSPSDAHAMSVHAGNGVELQAKFNGQGPIDLIFDTGSMNIMSASLAKKLGLTVAGTGQLDAGGGPVPAKTTIVDRVQIGGVTLHHQLFAVIDAPSGQVDDFAFVGDQWLHRLPVRIDFDRQQITFYNPRYFNPPGKRPFIPVYFEGNAVVGKTSVDGIPALLTIDTGSIYSLFLDSSFVKEHDLVHRYSATIHGYAGRGLGGAESGFYTRVDALQFSSFTVKRPIAVLLDETQGSGASHDSAGIVGLRILRRFTLLFDCPTGRLYMEPSASYNKPDIFNRAGLVIDADGEQARIMMVIPDSPAAEAGLETGDVITQIDGAAPTDASLTSAFERPKGTRIHLTVLHSGVVRIVSCSLRGVL
jgi:Aspartyl protease/PDZ domain